MAPPNFYKHLEDLMNARVDVCLGPDQDVVCPGEVTSINTFTGTVDIKYDDGREEKGVLVGNHFQDGEAFKLTDTFLLSPENAKPHPSRSSNGPSDPCGRCHTCKTTEGSCLMLDANAVASKGVFSGVLSAKGRHACLKRVQIMLNAVLNDKKLFKSGTITDFDPYSYRHQVTYDDGTAEDLRLWTLPVRPMPEAVLAKGQPKWLSALESSLGKVEAAGFGVRAYQDKLEAGRPLKYYSRDGGGWSNATVVSWNPLYNAHEFAVEGGAQVVFKSEENMILYSVDGAPAGLDEAGGEDPESDVDTEDMLAGVEPMKQPVRKRGRGRPKAGEEPNKKRKEEKPKGNPITALPPHVSFGDVMTWVADFLTGDQRVPLHIRQLMSLHFKVRDAQLARNLPASHPTKFYSHALSEAGINVPKDMWNNEHVVKEAIAQADPELQSTWIAQQGLINTLFVPCNRKKLVPPPKKEKKEEDKVEAKKEGDDPEDTAPEGDVTAEAPPLPDLGV